MKYLLEVSDTKEFFDKVEQDKMFTCKESVSGLNVRYNAVTTIVSNPKINLIEKSSTSVEIDIFSGVLMNVLCIAFTIFFWAIGIIAIVSNRLNLALIILTFLLPSIMWVLRFVFNKVVGKQIVDELRSL
jgi:hypothetical protein